MNNEALERRSGIKDINMWFIISLISVVAIGFVQFGYSLGSWNSTCLAYIRLNKVTADEYPYYQSMIQALSALGSCFGSIGAGRFT